jgi:hypothetical protein
MEEGFFRNVIFPITDSFYDIQAVLKKYGPRYNFAKIDDPNEKNYTGNEMALKTLQI